MNSRKLSIKSWLLSDQIYDRLEWDDFDLVWTPDHQGLAEKIDVVIDGKGIFITLRPEDYKVFLMRFPEDTPAEEIIESVALQVIFS